MLIELATGKLTSSTYHDATLARVLSGELAHFEDHPQWCSALSAIKTHSWSAFKQKKQCGGSIDTAVLLVRHPFAAIWSEFQREMAQRSSGGDGGAKTGCGSSRSCATDRNPHGTGSSLTRVPAEWADAARALARQYVLLHTPKAQRGEGGVECTGACASYTPSQWYGEAVGAARAVSYADWRDDATKRSTYLYFEELIDADKRYAALGRALRFARADASAERVACAFEMSDIASVHRAASSGLTAREAFAAVPDVADAVWAEVAATATALGYTRDGY